MIRAILSFLFLLCFGSMHAQEKITAVTGATIITVTGESFQNGVLLFKDGIITSAGNKADVSIPADALVVDASGKVIMPGLVDTHSHVGGVSGGDRSSPTHPDVRALDGIDPMSDSFWRARAGGITTLNIMPGSGHLMSGQTVYVKSRIGKTMEEILFCKDPLNEICGGLKMANGTNSIGGSPFPGTRAKSASIIRQLFIRAKEYQKKTADAKGDATKMPKRDLEMETLVQVLEGKRIVQHHTHKAEDILTVLRIAKEFGYKVVLHHVSEGWLVADEIAKAKAPCSIILIDSPGGKLEAKNLLLKNGGVLEKAGVDIAYHTDDYITDSRLFLRSAALGMRAGLSRQKALESMTIAGARMLGLENRVGSLEVGKDADFIILTGDPFSIYTHIEQTWIDGKIVFNRNNEEHYKYSVGGYKAYNDIFDNHIDENNEEWGGR